MPQPGQHAVRVSRGLVAADGVLIVGSMTEVDAARPGTSTVPGALWASEVTKDPSGHGLRHVHATTEALRYSGCWPLRMGRPMWSDRQVGVHQEAMMNLAIWHPRKVQSATIYQVTDRSHDGAQHGCLVTRSLAPCPVGCRSWAPKARWPMSLRVRCGSATGPLRTQSVSTCPLRLPLRSKHHLTVSSRRDDCRSGG